MMKICDRCQTRYVVSKMNTDFVHKCNSTSAVLDNEDVVVIGDWTDYTGSAVVSPSVLGTAGTQNELQGTRAGIQGGNFDGVTNRGKRKSTHRTRQHLEYKDLREEIK